MRQSMSEQIQNCGRDQMERCCKSGFLRMTMKNNAIRIISILLALCISGAAGFCFGMARGAAKGIEEAREAVLKYVSGERDDFGKRSKKMSLHPIDTVKVMRDSIIWYLVFMVNNTLAIRK